jgi:hypothetical protein
MSSSQEDVRDLSARTFAEKGPVWLPLRSDPYRNAFTIKILTNLAEPARGAVIAAICHLADYLDEHAIPIDYQRRRTLSGQGMVTDHDWKQLCHRARAHPGGRGNGPSRRALDARLYLYQLLTGADLYDQRHALAFRTGRDAGVYYHPSPNS